MAIRNRKPSLDLDGRAKRVRITLQIYDPVAQVYRSKPDHTARFSVDDMAEVRRLWGAIIGAMILHRDNPAPADAAAAAVSS